MKNENFLEPIEIKIFYDKELQKITHTAFEPAVISEGMTFVSMVYFIFSSYPEISKKYPPGILGFELNSRPPKKEEILKDGDEIAISVFHFNPADA